MKHTLLFVFFFFGCLHLGAQSASYGQQAEDLRVFPNPVIEYFQIGFSDRVQRIQVMNSIGRKVRSFDYASNTKYNISDLPSGYYLVQLIGDKHTVIRTQRISKQ